MAKLARVVGLVQEEQPSDMTNHPRYSPPPQQPGTPGYAQGQQQTYSQQFDWRYPPSPPPQPTQYRQPYEALGGTRPV